jgi:predicted DCC family thiol-disulfide oxidoreductase YuxK
MPADNGWTGAQYSLVRAAAGAALAARFVAHAVPSHGSELVLHLGGALWSSMLALGLRERAASFALGPTLIAAGLAAGDGAPGQVHWLAYALLLHLSTPEAPYGSWDARARLDPGGGWRMSPRTLLAARLGLLGTLATFALAAAGLTRSEPYLACAWLAALSFDPRWIAPRPAAAVEHVFYDGTCGLCHRLVRFLLAEDPRGERFRLSPLQGETLERLAGAAARASLPDSVVVRTADGRMLVRSRATFHLLARLGGAWRALAALGSLVPRPIGDAAYDGVARIRHRLFRRPETACPLLPPELAKRFDP